jgi:MerR HTH family regulatory protein
VAVLLMLNLARVHKMRMKNAKKSYSTREAAAKLRVSFRTLNRWLSLGKVRPSLAVPLGGGRTLWRWTDADIAKARKVKAAQKPGPKPRMGRHNQ